MIVELEKKVIDNMCVAKFNRCIIEYNIGVITLISIVCTILSVITISCLSCNFDLYLSFIILLMGILSIILYTKVKSVHGYLTVYKVYIKTNDYLPLIKYLYNYNQEFTIIEDGEMIKLIK